MEMSVGEVTKWSCASISIPETHEPHIHQHGVTEDSGGSRIALGQTDDRRRPLSAGDLRPRPLDPDRLGAFVVTAYDLREKALAAYRRRRKQR
jgi:hypothetical protein